MLSPLTTLLAAHGVQVCATLAQCGELFLQLPGVTATPLLAQALSKGDSSSADLLFDTGKEADAWKVRNTDTSVKLAVPLQCSQCKLA